MRCSISRTHTHTDTHTHTHKYIVSVVFFFNPVESYCEGESVQLRTATKKREKKRGVASKVIARKETVGHQQCRKEQSTSLLLAREREREKDDKVLEQRGKREEGFASDCENVRRFFFSPP